MKPVATIALLVAFFDGRDDDGMLPQATCHPNHTHGDAGRDPQSR